MGKLVSHTETGKRCLDLYLKALGVPPRKQQEKNLFRAPTKGDNNETLTLKNLPVKMSPAEMYDFFERLAHINSIDMLPYIKQAAIAYGRDDEEEHIKQIFHSIFLNTLAKKAKDGLEPLIETVEREEGVNYERHAYLTNNKKTSFKLKDLYYGKKLYNNLFASLWQSHSVPSHPALDQYSHVPPIMTIY